MLTSPAIWPATTEPLSHFHQHGITKALLLILQFLEFLPAKKSFFSFIWQPIYSWSNEQGVQQLMLNNVSISFAFKNLFLKFWALDLLQHERVPTWTASDPNIKTAAAMGPSATPPAPINWIEIASNYEPRSWLHHLPMWLQLPSFCNHSISAQFFYPFSKCNRWNNRNDSDPSASWNDPCISGFQHQL